MNRNALGATLALIAASTAHAQQAVQWRVQDGGNGHWYRVVPEALNWAGARDRAVSLGGHLATLTSESEAQQLRQISTDTCWIGLFQNRGSPAYAEPSGGWEWVTGEQLAYTNWRLNNNGQPNEPNNIGGWEDWAHLDAQSITWNDMSDTTFAFAIEWSADCNGDGIVDYGQCRDGTLPDYNGNNIPDCCESGAPCVVGNYPVEWRVSEGGNGHWYQRNSQNERWAEARVTSESAGGHLVTLTTAAEQSFVWSALRLYGAGYFLGAEQQPDSCEPGCGWTWITGEPWVYTNWASFAPDNNTIIGDENRLCTNIAGNWDDFADCVACVDRFVIEWSADCNGDGIVDKGQILRGQLPDFNNNGIPDTCEPTSPSLVVNGGFELSLGETQPDCTWTLHSPGGLFIPGWSVVSGSIDRCRLSASCPPGTESWTSFEGEFTIDLDGSTNGGAIAQTVVTDPGARYRLLFQLTGNCQPGFTGSKRMRVEIGSNNYVFEHSCSNTNPQTWSGKALEFTASSGTTTIVFRSLSQGGLNGAVIDAVRLIRLDPQQPTCRNADLLADRNVNGTDLGILLSQWGANTQYTISDISRDGVVDGTDLGLLLSFWGACPY